MKRKLNMVAIYIGGPPRAQLLPPCSKAVGCRGAHTLQRTVGDQLNAAGHSGWKCYRHG
jgi:hypothetical protein